MRRIAPIYASIMLVVLALAPFMGTSSINAQQLRTCPDGTAPYYVERGDTVWGKKGPTWNDGWSVLVDHNPWLVNRRIDYTPNKVIVVLRIGEPICGLTESGLEIGPRPTREAESESTATAHAVAVDPPEADNTSEAWSFPWWAWLLIASILLARWWWRFTHPTTAGRPRRSEPLSSSDPEMVADYAARLGSDRYGRLASTNRPNYPRRVGDIETGLVSGLGRVQYADGNSSVRLMRREPGFRARFRMPNGTTEDLIFLAACGNDITFSGTRYLGYTFEPTGTLGVVAQNPTLPSMTPTPTFGLVQARERLALGGTDKDLQLYLLMLRHTGVRVTLGEEIEREQAALLEAAVGFEATFQRALAEVEELQAQIVQLRALAQIAGGNAASRREDIEKLQQFLALFIPPPPAPVAEPAEDDTVQDVPIDSPPTGNGTQTG